MKTCIHFIGILFILNSSNTIAQKSIDTTISLWYKTNEWQLDSIQKNQLQKVIPNITSINKIESFADSVGTKEDNYILSKKRGSTVQEYFKNLNLILNNKNVYWGESHLMDTIFKNNRRVDIYCSVRKSVDFLAPLNTEEYNIIEQNNETKADSIVLNLENILFVPDRAYIEVSSVEYLEVLANQLKSYNSKSIKIIGHSNKGGIYYYQLSEERAKTIYVYLISKGFKVSSLYYKGIGNSNPKYENPQSEDEMRKNIRVEVVVKF